MGKKKFKFEGLDYTELAEYFDIDLSEATNPDIDESEIIASWIMQHAGWSPSKPKKRKKIVKACRKYLKTFIGEFGGPEEGKVTSVWQAILEIENDGTFLMVFTSILKFLWS